MTILDFLVWRRDRGRVLRDRVRILGVLDMGLEVEKEGNEAGVGGRGGRNERSGSCSCTISITPTIAGTLQDEW